MLTSPSPFTVSCPDCGVKRLTPCVYRQPSAPFGTAAYYEQKARAGKPTRRAHNGRFRKAHMAQRAAERKARDDAWADQHAASPERAAILRANADAMAEEQRQLVSWLVFHSHILTGEN